jgi:hypothetical protein
MWRANGGRPAHNGPRGPGFRCAPTTPLGTMSSRAWHLGCGVGCKIRMFKFGNIDVEFLEPGPEKSAWRDLLEEKGPGCHHIAFRTRNLTGRGAYLESKGHRLLQRENSTARTAGTLIMTPSRTWA